MADIFPTRRLGDILSFRNGKASPTRIDTGEFPVYGANGIMGYASVKNVDQSSIVIGRVGSYCGALHLASANAWVTDNAIIGSPKDGNDAAYLYYLLGSLDLNSYRAGSGQPLLNQEILSRIECRVPEYVMQRRIARILGTLDDKIELNRQMNRTLEEMARTLFKAWFVDFAPVRAKAEGRDTGLPAEIADLFPARLVDSELGEIPEGWGVGRLCDFYVVAKGLSYKGDFLADPGEGLPLFNLNSVYEGGGYKADGLKWYTGEYRDRHIVQGGDLIVTNTEQGFQYLLIGYPAFVPVGQFEKGLHSHHTFKITARDNSTLSLQYLYHLLRTPWFHDVVTGYTNGTTVNMLSADGLQRPLVVVPPASVIKRFDSMAEPIQRRIEASVPQNRTLAELRDTLLPRLLSGELRVGPAEVVVGDVV